MTPLGSTIPPWSRSILELNKQMAAQLENTSAPVQSPYACVIVTSGREEPQSGCLGWAYETPCPTCECSNGSRQALGKPQGHCVRSPCLIFKQSPCFHYEQVLHKAGPDHNTHSKIWRSPDLLPCWSL